MSYPKRGEIYLIKVPGKPDDARPGPDKLYANAVGFSAGFDKEKCYERNLRTYAE